MIAAARRLWGSSIVRYVVVGAGNTVFNYAIFAVLQLLVGRFIGYGSVLVVAFIISAMIAHTGHRHITFRSAAEGTTRRFFMVSVGMLGLNAAALFLVVEQAGVHVLVAQGLLTVVIAALGFVVHRTYTFHVPAAGPDGVGHVLGSQR